MNSYLTVWKKYADFSGRARRREYWMFLLFSVLISVGLALVDVSLGLVNKDIGMGPLGAIYSLLVIIPSLAVTVRRLQDTGHSGWTILLGIIPLIGPLILLVWMVRDSDPGKNKYGPNPKRVSKSREYADLLE